MEAVIAFQNWTGTSFSLFFTPISLSPTGRIQLAQDGSDTIDGKVPCKVHGHGWPRARWSPRASDVITFLVFYASSGTPCSFRCFCYCMCPSSSSSYTAFSEINVEECTATHSPESSWLRSSPSPHLGMLVGSHSHCMGVNVLKVRGHGRWYGPRISITPWPQAPVVRKILATT